MPIITFTNDETFNSRLPLVGNIRVHKRWVNRPVLHGDVAVIGRLVIRIPTPSPLEPLAGQISVRGHITGKVNQPSSAFTDFAHYPYGGTDPAMALISATSGALLSGATGTYTRPYATVTAPGEYPVSGGAFAWKRAAYAAVGFKFTSMTANKHQLLDAIQLEAVPVGTNTPSVYQTARSLNVIVKPTRLNYAANPNMESGITGFSSLNNAVLASDAFCWRGTKALKVSALPATTGQAGAAVTVNGLLPGRQYTMSARVAVAAGCGDVAPWTGQPSAVNLVLNPSTATVLDNTQSYGPTVTRAVVTTDARYGSSCIEHVFTADTSSGTTWSITPQGPGTTVQVGIWVKIPAGATSGLITWRSGTTTRKTVPLGTSTPSGVWTRVTGTYTAGASETIDRVGVSFTLPSGAVWWADAAMATGGTSALPDFGDGDQPGWAWDGTAHASSSRTVLASHGVVRRTAKSFRQAAKTATKSAPRWRTVSATFTTSTTSAVLGLAVSDSTRAPNIANIFWIDGLLVEEGAAVRPYFDGSMGDDYLWESAGTPNLTRSYFYENRVERGYLVKTLLSENTPLGIISAAPQYAVLPNQ